MVSASSSPSEEDEPEDEDLVKVRSSELFDIGVGNGESMDIQ